MMLPTSKLIIPTEYACESCRPSKGRRAGMVACFQCRHFRGTRVGCRSGVEMNQQLRGMESVRRFKADSDARSSLAYRALVLFPCSTSFVRKTSFPCLILFPS